ncbi:MAG: hypothetical protein PHQ34_03665 [Methanothrix sp.]|nr:hypothetical protein [Methanothrix sp.]
MAGSIHNEMILEATEERVGKAALKLREIMERAVGKLRMPHPIPVRAESRVMATLAG